MNAQHHRPAASRGATVYEENERIAAKAHEYRFVSRVPMLCECGHPGCAEILLVTLSEYRRLRREHGELVVAGHSAA
jgi:hypothetical protein